MRQQFDKLLRISPIQWQRILEDSRLLRGYLNKVILLATDGLTKEMCIGAYLFSKQVIRLVRRSGFLFTALYLSVHVPCSEPMGVVWALMVNILVLYP